MAGLSRSACEPATSSRRWRCWSIRGSRCGPVQGHWPGTCEFGSALPAVISRGHRPLFSGPRTRASRPRSLPG